MNKQQNKALELLRASQNLNHVAVLFSQLLVAEVMEVLIAFAAPYWEQVYTLAEDKHLLIEISLPEAYKVELKLYEDKDDQERYIDIILLQEKDKRYTTRYVDYGKGFVYKSTFTRPTSPRKMVELILKNSKK